MNYSCEALIEDRPCHARALWAHKKDGHLLCNHHYEISINIPQEIKFKDGPYGMEYQDAERHCEIIA